MNKADKAWLLCSFLAGMLVSVEHHTVLAKTSSMVTLWLTAKNRVCNHTLLWGYNPAPEVDVRWRPCIDVSG
eukprot:5669348-Amphidinium_carterae.2